MSKHTPELCHKCGKPMEMTPVCCECGIIPIAELSFRYTEQKNADLLTALENIKSICKRDFPHVDTEDIDTERIVYILAEIDKIEKTCDEVGVA